MSLTLADGLNAGCGLIMTAICARVAIVIRAGEGGLLYSAIGCGCWWFFIAIFYTLSPGIEPSYDGLLQLIDMIGTIPLLIACCALYRRDEFSIRSPEVLEIVQVGGILVVLSWFTAIIIRPNVYVLLWRAFSISPSATLSCAAFVLLGIFGARRFPEFKWSIYAVCFGYALLMGPAYFEIFLQPSLTGSPPSEALDFIKELLFGGKTLLALQTAAIIVTRRYPHVSRFARTVNYLLPTLTFLVSIVSLYRQFH